MKTELDNLQQRWHEYRQLNPKIRIRDAAHELGVSEAELLATRTGNDVTRLAADWPQLIKTLPKLGRVMCLTRNEAAVHERFGSFMEIDFFHGMGQVVGPDIDLRLFMEHWQHGYAVSERGQSSHSRIVVTFFMALSALFSSFLLLWQFTSRGKLLAYMYLSHYLHSVLVRKLFWF